MPVAKGRPKFSRGPQFVRVYTPAKTERYENLVKLCAAGAMGSHALLDGPLEVSLVVYLPIPTSWSKKKQAAALAGTVMPTKKPDLDNITKALKDGMNQVVYHDDAQVVDAHLWKRYAATPRVAVRVLQMSAEAA